MRILLPPSSQLNETEVTDEEGGKLGLCNKLATFECVIVWM